MMSFDVWQTGIVRKVRASRLLAVEETTPSLVEMTYLEKRGRCLEKEGGDMEEIYAKVRLFRC
jgi:hypothetical protein